MRALIRFLCIVLLTAFAGGNAWAFTVQTVTSPGGISAWLVESHSIPIISMNFAFDGGAGLDSPGKEGTANFLTGMMDEGAADMDGPTFRAARDRISMNLSFDADADNFTGSLTILSRNRDEAFALLAKAVQAPHQDPEAMERMRQTYLQSIANAQKDQNTIASQAWLAMAFPGHVYGRPLSGTSESVNAITAADVKAMHQTLFSRRNLKISVAGDIDAATLGRLLDQVFGPLPDKPVPQPFSHTSIAQGPQSKTIAYDGPQSAIIFGGPGIAGDDPGYYAASLLFEMLGGDASFARLNQAVREERGLTYGINFSNNSARLADFSIGFFTTNNATSGEAMRVVTEELKRLAAEGVTEKELKSAKTYSNGSYVLRFDSNAAISASLLAQQLAGLPPTHAATRAAKINAVTVADVNAQARKLLDPSKLLVVVVGQPQGM